jgi:hypothetical protein
MSHTDEQIEQAVSALLACPRVEDAAKQSGISRTTLWRMSQDPTFKLRLQEARSQLSEQIVISLQANTLDAVNTLRSIMLDKRASTSARISAAGKLIDLSLRAKQQLDVEQRLAAVELSLRGRKGGRNEIGK